MPLKINKSKLDQLYRQFNRKEYVHPDPLEFLYSYSLTHDREIVGLVSSSLAYGQVTQILKSVSTILKKLGPTPSAFLKENSKKDLTLLFNNFKHRWHTGTDIAALLYGIRCVLGEYGTLQNCFLVGIRKNEPDLSQALSRFVSHIIKHAPEMRKNLLPLPSSGSACKRLYLFLRWMVRNDEVDPGGWDEVPQNKLVIPLDTHMFRMAQMLKLTQRKQANSQSALEITAAFRKLEPNDPVKYDFILTRPGIWKNVALKEMIQQIVI